MPLLPSGPSWPVLGLTLPCHKQQDEKWTPQYSTRNVPRYFFAVHLVSLLYIYAFIVR
jgi:hypothetical protein